MQSQDRRGLRIWVSGDIPQASAIVGLDLLVTSEHPLQLSVDASSFVMPVPTCDRSALFQVVDLCSGLGGLQSLQGALVFLSRQGLTRIPCGSPFSKIHTLGPPFVAVI